MKFDVNNQILESKVIGSFSLSNKCNFNLKSTKLKKTSFKDSDNFLGFCVLPNENILCCCKNHVTVYDRKLNERRRLEECWSFPVTNESNCIYFIETNYRIMSVSIIMTDFDFKLIKKINFDKYLILNICYFQDHLYVSDYNHETIQKMNFNLDHVNNFQLQYKPLRIEINDFVACILSNTLVNIHDARTFKPLKTISNTTTCIRDFGIVKIGSWFLTYNHNGKYLCFDNQGNIFDEFEIEIENEKFVGPFINFNGMLLALNLKNNHFYQQIQ